MTQKPGTAVEVGDGIRMVGFPPRGARHGGRPHGPPQLDEPLPEALFLGEPPHHRRRGRRPPMPRVIEFVPQHAAALAHSAGWTFNAGVIAALVLLLAAFASWRIRRRTAVLLEERARERHLTTLGTMSAVIAHEIRNPLTALKGHAQLLAEVLPAGGRNRNKAERVVNQALRLEALTEELLSFVRSNRVQPQVACPRALLADAAEMVSTECITLDVDEAPEAWSFDPMRMQQVLVNILRNAMQATAEGTRVAARVCTHAGGLRFTVRDYGEGLPADKERLFEAFITRRTRGTGLGLAIARLVVSLHGGTITANNHPEGGAVFQIWLPPRKMQFGTGV